MCVSLRWILAAAGGILVGLSLVSALVRQGVPQDRSAHLGWLAPRRVPVNDRTGMPWFHSTLYLRIACRWSWSTGLGCAVAI